MIGIHKSCLIAKGIKFFNCQKCGKSACNYVNGVDICDVCCAKENLCRICGEKLSTEIVKPIRKDWDEYFLDIAEEVATRSTCDKLNVGCVITKNKRLVSTGYNGSVRGADHCDEVGHLLNAQGSCIRTVHAEQNAIIFAKEDLEGATAYITHEPCDTCLKLLLQAGVTRIVFRNVYKRSQYNQEILKGLNNVSYERWVKL